VSEVATGAAHTLSDASALIRGAQRPVVMAHVNPDADAIGSVLGLVDGFRALGKEAIGVLEDPVPEYAGFLAGAGDIRSSLDGLQPDLLVLADSAGIDRVGALYSDNLALFERLPVLNIDHHRTNPLFGTVNYVDPVASSTSELSYRLLTDLGAPIAPDTATALLFGIEGDTGSFRNGATTPGALSTAAALLALGADTQRVAFQLFERKTFAAARLWGRIISTIELDRGRQIVFATMTQAMVRAEGASVDETEGVAEYLRGVEEAEVVMLLKETEDGEIRVSMRSRPAVDVSAIATSLGGGGHRQAAGCTLPGPPGRAKMLLVETFDKAVSREF
jgi:phosphoesterase RecJ-like protein